MIKTPRKIYRGKPVMTLEERWDKHLQCMRSYSKQPQSIVDNQRRNRECYYRKQGKPTPSDMERRIKKFGAKKMLILYRRRVRQELYRNQNHNHKGI